MEIKPPDIPLMLISAACPPVLTAEIPGNRVNASAIETSGKLPKSSAVSCSETVSAKRFWLIDSMSERRKPVTSITSTSLLADTLLLVSDVLFSIALLSAALSASTISLSLTC